MMERSKILGGLLAATLASTTSAVSGELIGGTPRKWSQPSYDEAPEPSPSTAPELENFIAIPENDDAALFDGESRSPVQDEPRSVIKSLTSDG